MYHNFKFTNINEALPHLLESVRIAPEVGSRAGKTRELTYVGITLTDPLSRELLVPGRKANLAAQIAETAWVLAGRNDIEWLSHYLPRARDFSDDGKTWRAGYGPRLRGWKTHTTADGFRKTDQLAYVVDVLRADPETRQAVIMLWDPIIDELAGKDRACNNWLHFLSRGGVLDLHVGIRSNDAMWGWSGINAFEWSVLLEVIAGLTGLRVGSLHFSVTSFHLYERHWDKAKRIVDESAVAEQVTAEPSPRFNPLSDELGDFDDLLERWFQIEYDIRTGSPLVQPYVDNFPEPMLRSWLRVLDWWWNGPRFASLPGDALAVAAGMGVKPPWNQPKEMVELRSFGSTKSTFVPAVPEPSVSPFLTYVINLHNEKHAAYGDSWKRRGEMLGIMANIARKIDRLGGSATADETSADTALDLMVYLVKYKTWLADQKVVGTALSDNTDTPNAILLDIERMYNSGWTPHRDAEAWLTEAFDRLERKVMTGDPERGDLVQQMSWEAYALARSRWEDEEAAGLVNMVPVDMVHQHRNREIDRAVYEEFHPGSTGNPTEYPGADHE